MAEERVYIPTKLQRRGCMLLNQQCWLWGQDIRRKDGNVLLARGFERLRAPDGSSASSQYTLGVDCGRLRLWGFGLFYGSVEEGIYLNRFEFMPRTVKLGGAGGLGAGELQGLRVSGDAVLLGEVVRWIAGYERWVLMEYGLPYRRGCLCGWKKRHVAPEQLPGAWEEFAEALAAAVLPLAG